MQLQDCTFGLMSHQKDLRPMKIVAGNSNRALAEEISKYLDVPLASCQVRRFADQDSTEAQRPVDANLWLQPIV